LQYLKETLLKTRSYLEELTTERDGELDDLAKLQHGRGIATYIGPSAREPQS